MKLLLTGFTAFPGVETNPSQLIVESIAARQRPEIVTHILPVAYEAAERTIRALIHQEAPDIVVCLGVSLRRKAINPERFALNIRDAQSADNTGMVADGMPIVPGGPAAYQSTLPLGCMRRELEQREIPVRLSNHAGAYICNLVFYAARHEIEQIKRDIPCGFIHVPGIAEGEDDPGLAWETMRAGIETCLDCCFQAAGYSLYA